MQLHYIASDIAYVQALSPYFKAQGVELFRYSRNITAHNLILLIFSPIKCGKLRLSPERVWKKGLAAENPDAILLSAGFEESQHSNYLDILNLPERLVDFLTRAKRAKDDWQPLFTGGLEMEEKLARFFKGHGKESVVKELIKINGKISALFEAVTEWQKPYEKVAVEAFDTDYTWHHWKIFINRWAYYYPFFEYLPFSEEIHLLDADIKNIAPFFESQGREANLFFSTNCAATVNRIQNTLNAIERTYVES